ncbi:unnamed protein product [Bursaphelenchus xylophilus]|uniref:(pine wood nematode) hypothetical protein n=1 Tax=Bursaphelenchus xylophilus TaxID=6326 RepID=A0A1I7RXC3_BURXY|nr:unnamed protein product [Bursaphelenchus xylophilus]CAG9121556.1 unnamed protein product [Bursaphelenchus xylophilus]
MSGTAGGHCAIRRHGSVKMRCSDRGGASCPRVPCLRGALFSEAPEWESEARRTAARDTTLPLHGERDGRGGRGDLPAGARADARHYQLPPAPARTVRSRPPAPPLEAEHRREEEEQNFLGRNEGRRKEEGTE